MINMTEWQNKKNQTVCLPGDVGGVQPSILTEGAQVVTEEAREELGLWT